MNGRVLKQIPSIAMMAGFFLVFVSYFDTYLNAVGLLPFLNVFLFIWGLVVVTGMTLLRAMASPHERGRVLELYRKNIAVLAPLAAIVLLSFASAFVPTALLDQGPRYVLYPAYNAAIVALSMLLPFQEHHRRWMRWYLALAFALAAASVFIDVIRPGTFSIVPDRAAGFARNPNGGGFLLVAMCCALIAFDRVRGFDLVILAVTALGVIATLSRGAFLLLAFTVCCYGPCVVRHSMRRGFGVLLTRMVALVVLAYGTYAATSRLMDQRMFSGGGDGRVAMLLGKKKMVGKRESRVELAKEGWELVQAHPWVGYGSGFTFSLPEGPHNMYVSRWLDNGLPGVVAYVWLLGASALVFWRRRYLPGVVFTGVVALEGFFSHNLLEERAFILPFGILLTQSVFFAKERLVATQPAPSPRPSVGVLEPSAGRARNIPVALTSTTSPRTR